jgi:hypothetical protein
MITINDTYQLNAPKSLDGKYLKTGTTVYTSTAEAISTVPSAYRSQGLTVNVTGIEYWWKVGTADGQLVIKDNVPQIQSDWNSVSGLSQILNKPTLATVATTGAYADLTGKPTIPAQVALVAGTNITITGSYPNLTINSTGGGSGSSLTSVTYSSNQPALVGDLDKLVFVNANGANVTYTITPATFTNKVLRVYGLANSSFVPLIALASGTISGLSSYGLSDQECLTIFSDGTNLFIIAKN